MTIGATRPLRIVISGRAAETDAPTVEDLLGQLRDLVAVLRDVERAVATEDDGEIEWRVTDASRSSPLALEITPFPKRSGLNIDRRFNAVRKHAAKGLAALRESGERPAYFGDHALASAGQLFRRVTNGLAVTEIDFGDGLPALTLTAGTAGAAAANASQALAPQDRPYREIGSVEGYFRSLKRDTRGRPLLFIGERAMGTTVRCIVRGAALQQVERQQIGDVWKPGRRVLVSGLIRYEAPGRIKEVVASDVRLLRERAELPKVKDIIDPDFTGGLSSEEYLEAIRSGERH
jgi:hypothetical protein